MAAITATGSKKSDGEEGERYVRLGLKTSRRNSILPRGGSLSIDQNESRLTLERPISAGCNGAYQEASGKPLLTRTARQADFCQLLGFMHAQGKQI